jgi:hypothetical protein
MASRQFRSGVSLGSLIPNMRILCGTVDGYAGTEQINGVKAVSSPSTGAYKLELEDKYVALVCVQATLEKVLGSAKSVMVDSHDVTGADPYIQLIVVDGSGLPVDLDADELVHVHVTLRDSTVLI